MSKIIQRLADIFEDPYNDNNNAFWSLLSDHDYTWETYEEDEDHSTIEWIDDENGDRIYEVDSDGAGDFWRRLPTHIAHEIVLLFEGTFA